MRTEKSFAITKLILYFLRKKFSAARFYAVCTEIGPKIVKSLVSKLCGEKVRQREKIAQKASRFYGFL